MSPRVAVAVIVVALALAGAAWMLWAPAKDKPASMDPAVAGTEPTDEGPADEEQELVPASLYFPGDDGWLHPVEISVPADDVEAQVQSLVNALLQGPGDGELLLPALPEGAQLDGLYFLSPETVALDFRLRRAPVAAPVGDAPAVDDDESAGDGEGEDSAAATPAEELLTSRMARMGTKEELLTVYSVVNTVVLGAEAVERVVLMVDGKQPPTLAGHVDLTRPLRPDPSWIRASKP